MDKQFINKVYRSIALAWAIAITWTLAFQKPWIALSITFGTLLGTAALASNDWAVRRALTPGARRPTRALAKVALLKYPAIAVLLYFLVNWHAINLLAFVGGIVLVYLAIVAKALGIMIVERLNARTGRSDSVRTHAKRS
ncbi:MAG TPA: ATP synthase subunit I [Armatimonadota bacterium]|nr:ATP synthase subunit I [Armatimonadota bacterium]